MKIRKERTAKKLLSLLLAAIVTVTFTPMFDAGSFAADEGIPAGADEELRYVEKLPNGQERELDPEIFTEDGEVVNADELKDIGIDIFADEEIETKQAAEASMPGWNELAAALAAENARQEAKDPQEPEPEVEEETPGVPEDITEETPDAAEDEPEGEVIVEEPEEIAPEDPAEEPNEEPLPEPEGEKIETDELMIMEPDEGVIGDISTSGMFFGKTEVPIVKLGTAIYEQSSVLREMGVSYDPAKFTVSQPGSNGLIHVNGTFASDVTPNNGSLVIYIDGSSYKTFTWPNTKTTYISTDIDIRGLSPGMHYVYVGARPTSSASMQYTDYKYFASSIYDAPSQGVGSFAFYSNYFDYMSPAFDFVAINKGYKLYMDYYKNGKYAGTYGPMNYYQNAQIGGLTPDSNYSVNLYYGKVVPYNGVNYFLTGKDNGRAINAGSFRTGKAKLPKIKSIKVKAVKVKARKAGVYGWYTGYYFGKVKYYTYKIKVTVKFKKKPGTPGIYLNGVYRKGNKKTYSKTFGTYAAYSRPRGKKFVVTLYSSQNPSYGGYSPLYSKKKKVS